MKIAALVVVVVCVVCTAFLASLNPGLTRLGIAAWSGAGPVAGILCSWLNGLPSSDNVLRWVLACSGAVLLFQLFTTVGAFI